jgi:type IV pilus assembly protein PilB
MPLGKIQLQIVSKLVEMGRLDSDQRTALAARSDDLSGDALDKLLQDEFKVSAFQCLVAKARALHLSPFNVAHYRVTPIA